MLVKKGSDKAENAIFQQQMRSEVPYLRTFTGKFELF